MNSWRTETKIVNGLLVVGGISISVLASSFVSRSPPLIADYYLIQAGLSSHAEGDQAST